MAKDSTKKTLLVAFGVCLVASILVSTAAVTLKPLQERNKSLDLLKNILIAGNLYEDGIDIEKTFQEKVSVKIIDLKSGETVPESEFDEILSIEKFDINKLASSTKWGRAIPSREDIAGIRRMPTVMAVYTVITDGVVDKYIFPVHGQGLWSTMYGFIALGSDLKTVKGFTFYQHGETPGLGGEIDNPRWKESWIGKKAFDYEGNLKIEVLKGLVDQTNKRAIHQIDGISGSTLTARGVSHLVRFWLGEKGYGPFIEKMKEAKNDKV